MHRLYKNILIEKLSRFVCDIRYRTGEYSFEKPFRISPNANLHTLVDSPTVEVIDLVDDCPKTIHFSDVLMFGVKETLTEEELQNRLNRYKQLFSVFKCLSGKSLSDLFFRCDVEENCYERMRHLRMLDALKLSHLDDYTRLINNDPRIVNSLRELWCKLIMEKFQQTMQALDEEKASVDDESILSELNTIQDIIKSAPEEAKVELQRRNTVESVVDYWPTLLLPRSTLFWVDKKVNVT